MTFYPAERPNNVRYFNSTPSPVANHVVTSSFVGFLEGAEPGKPLTADEQAANVVPRGGVTTGPGMILIWQDEPLTRDARGEPVVPATGTFIEDVLLACERRIEFYEETAFPCPENKRALAKIRGARGDMADRQTRRKAQGIMGKETEEVTA